MFRKKKLQIIISKSFPSILANIFVARERISYLGTLFAASKI